jgi:hypothetical protein
MYNRSTDPSPKADYFSNRVYIKVLTDYIPTRLER